MTVIVKVWALEVPPPGAGLKTITEAVPTAAISAALMAAVTCVTDTNVVVRSEPFQRTTELVTKPLPSTVNVKAEPPAMAVAGLRPVVVGTGLLMVYCISTVEVEVPTRTFTVFPIVR